MICDESDEEEMMDLPQVVPKNIGPRRTSRIPKPTPRIRVTAELVKVVFSVVVDNRCI